ncbi:PCRF domain-containing protein, partial [candidate division KSB1 bacterium]
MSDHRSWVETYRKVESGLSDLEALCELATLDSGGFSESELDEEHRRFLHEFENLEMRAMLTGRDDARNAIIHIHPGAGGTESNDWAEMLMRMYMRWFETRGWKTDILDLESAEEAGIRGVIIEVIGEYAYGFCKAELGVHRLVRISPFDSNARRHTSFASVFVYPEVDDVPEIEIKPDDLKIDTYRASGAGGQHVNRTESAIR